MGFYKITSFSLLILICISFASAGTLQDLINSYSFDYYSDRIDVINITDSISDTNGNSNPDTIFFTINVGNSTNGQFNFYIDLKNRGKVVSGSAVKSITGPPYSAQVNISTGSLTGNKFNYTIRIYDANDSLIYREGNLTTQQYTSYETTYAISNIQDSNIGNNIIRLNFTVNSPVSSTINVSAFMKYNSSYISSTIPYTFSTGNNNVVIDFDNETIKSTHFNGNYLIENIMIGNENRFVNHTTSSYNYETFAKSSYLEGFQDYFIDADSDNLTDYLRVNTTLTIKESGTYTIEEVLYDLDGDYLSTISKTQSLNIGEQIIPLDLNGSEVYKSGLTGPFEIAAARLIYNGQIVDSLINPYTTNITSYLDFERPPLPDLVPTSIEVFYNGSGNLVNVTVQNVGNDSAINVFVNLFADSFKSQAYLDLLNTSQSNTFNFFANGTTNGTRFIAIADLFVLVDELNESNNVIDNLDLPNSAPRVDLVSPSNNSVDSDGNVTFTCFVTDTQGISNITLYGDWGNGWHANETINLNGSTSANVMFNKLIEESPPSYKWNCLAFDTSSVSAWADSNWTFNVSIGALSIPELSVVHQNNTERIFKFVINNTYNQTIANITWELNTTQTRLLSQYNVTLQQGKDVQVIAYYNFTSSGNYTVKAIARKGVFRVERSINVTIL